jgi:GH24 family phage-related lysozyme (muramidase)
MAAINPTDVTALIVDEFIRNATTHLTTVSGIANTLSIFPPLPSAAPGIINWTGYTVGPATYTKTELRDRLILNEILAKPNDGSIQIETDPEINRQFNENKGAIEGYKVDPDAGGFSDGVTDLVVSNIIVPAILPASLVYADIKNTSSTPTTTPTTTPATTGNTSEGDAEGEEVDIGGISAPVRPVFFVPTPPPLYNPGNVYSGEGYGASVSFGKLSVLSGGPTITIGSNKGLTREQYLKKLNFADGLTIANVDMSRDWATIATQYISKKEGYTGNATWDVNAYRLGYGTDKILDNGTLRVVRPDKAYYERTREEEPANGDRTTVENALKVLETQIRTTYKDAVVGTSDIKITEAEWNELNDRQRAGLVSFVYNCGSFKFATSIPKAIKAKDYIAAANGILNGAITGKNTTTGVTETYEGLIRRRAEEAGIFAYGL